MNRGKQEGRDSLVAEDINKYHPFAGLACLSFDLLVAAYVAIAIGVGHLRGRGSNRRRVA